MGEQEFLEVEIQGGEASNYLTVAGVLGLHAQIMGCDVQQARDRVRDIGGLESAVHRPLNAALYEEDADVPLQAAYLAHGLAEGQLFIDGNKRTALLAMETFLAANGFWLTASDDELADWMIELSQGLSVYDLAKRVGGRTKSFWD